jgi:hypothetical protein
VTNEAENLVDSFMAANGMRFPVVISTRETEALYGVRGFPHSVLISRTGSVAWIGHPGRLKDATIEAELAKAAAGAAPPPPAAPPPVVDPPGWTPPPRAAFEEPKTPEAWYGALLAVLRAGDFGRFERLHTPAVASTLDEDAFARLVGRARDLGSAGTFRETPKGVEVRLPGGRYLTTLRKVNDVWKADVSFAE